MHICLPGKISGKLSKSVKLEKKPKTSPTNFQTLGLKILLILK